MNHYNSITNINFHGQQIPIDEFRLKRQINEFRRGHGCFSININHPYTLNTRYPYAGYIVPLRTKLSINFARCRYSYDAIRLNFHIIAYTDWDYNGNFLKFYVEFNERNIQGVKFYSPKKYPRFNEKYELVNTNNYYQSNIPSKLDVIVRNNGNIDNDASANIATDLHQILMVINKYHTTINFNNVVVTQNWYNQNIQPGLTRIKNAIERKQVEMAKNQGIVRCVAQSKCPMHPYYTWNTSTLMVYVDIPNGMTVTHINQIKNLIQNNGINNLMNPQYCELCDKNHVRTAGMVLNWDIFDPTQPNHVVGGSHRSDLCTACEVGVCNFSAVKLNSGRFGCAMAIIRQLYNINNFNISIVNGKTLIEIQ